MPYAIFISWEHGNQKTDTNTANVLYSRYVLGEKFAAREQCLDLLI